MAWGAQRVEHLHGDFLQALLPVAGFDALVSWLIYNILLLPTNASGDFSTSMTSWLNAPLC